VITAYVITLLAAGLGMLMLITRNTQTVMVFACILLLLVLIFRVVGSLRLRETITGLERKYTIFQQKRQEMENFERIELHFRQANIFDEWWQAVCFASDKLDFAGGLLPLIRRDGTERTLVWEKDDGHFSADEVVRMVVPVRDRRASSSLNIEVQVHTNGSLESAGRRIALFTRLMDEHGIAGLSKNKAESSFVASKHTSAE
jgi:hypothetical protein